MSFNSMGTGPRSRAGFATLKSSGGGAGPTLTALLAMGPDFGEGAGNDGETFLSGYENLGMSQAGFINDAVTGVGCDLTQMEFTNDSTTGMALDFWSAGFTGNTVTGVQSGTPNTNNSFSGRWNYATIPFLHYAKGSLGVINPREDAATSNYWAFANKGTNSYTTNTSTYTIQPETVAGVTADERVLYVKWDLSAINTANGGDVPDNNVVLGFALTATNQSLVADATVNVTFRASSTDPWTGNPNAVSWNAVEPITVGDSKYTASDTVLANTTDVLAFFSSTIELDVGAKWLYAKVTTTLVTVPPAGPVLISVENASGNPNDYPGDYKAPAMFDLNLLLT